LAVLGGCRQDMHDQPRSEPLSLSDFFADQRSARPLVAGTVARGHLDEDTHLYTGMVDDDLALTFPFEVTAEVVARGRERFEIFCTPCHGRTGRGDGMVVRRGFKRPTSFHDERLRGEPPGYYFGVITQGFGAMSSYAAQVPASDRWAIIAYVRALQLSQHATLEDVPAERRGELAGEAP
jgi:cytochrome c553